MQPSRVHNRIRECVRSDTDAGKLGLSASAREQKLTLVLIGFAVGTVWGLIFQVLLLWVDQFAGDFWEMRSFTAVFAGATAGMCLACFWLGRWYTQLDGGAHWLSNGVAALTAADVLWYFGRLNVGAMPQTEMWCLTIALVSFIFATGFLARPKDNLFH